MAGLLFDPLILKDWRVGGCVSMSVCDWIISLLNILQVLG